MKKRVGNTRIVLVLVALLAAVIVIALLPPVRVRLARRLASAWADVRLFLNPPGEAVFVPTRQYSADWMATQVAATMQAMPGSTPPDQITPDLGIPTLSATPLPDSVDLPGVVYVDQHNRWNYCGPANLSMALNFWGWPGNRDDIAKVVRPGRNDPEIDFISRGQTDLNVMPYELVDFVNEKTGFRALWRYGGNIDLLRRLIAAGFPMVVEKGYFAHDTVGKFSWMGHYEFVTGYDDAGGTFLVQDAYEFGPDFLIAYDEFDQGWRAFDYLFMIVYPPDREENLKDSLGDWYDRTWAAQHALEVATRDAQVTTGMDLYFAWFNIGTSHVQLGQYGQAAGAYDRTFELYAGLGGENIDRPYRMLWYQTGPYFAYYYTGRYQDLVNLADITLATPRTGPTLEESLYWRALAEYALGDLNAAYADIRQTVYLNPNFQPGWDTIEEWGIAP